MTANLQDDPAIAPRFIEKWEQGYEMVYGVVTNIIGKSLIRRINSNIFYSLIKSVTNGLIPKDVSDYRLVDRKVIEALRQLKESNRFYRGFFSWVGLNQLVLSLNAKNDFLVNLKQQHQPKLVLLQGDCLLFQIFH